MSSNLGQDIMWRLWVLYFETKIAYLLATQEASLFPVIQRLLMAGTQKLAFAFIFFPAGGSF